MRLTVTFIIALTAATGMLAADAPKPPVAPPAQGAQSPVKGFDAFRLVKARNIFDPDRRGVPTAASTQRSFAQTPRMNNITLTGTMVADGKTLAFFSGSRSEYNKVISIGGSIADFKVTQVTNSQVELDHAGKVITVAVGKAVPLEGTAAAFVTEPAPDPNAPATTPDGAAPGTPPPDASTPAESKPTDKPADGKDDVLRRMMERRQQELSK